MCRRGLTPFVIQFQRVRDIARSVPELRKIINQMKNKDLINLKQMDRDECIEAFNEYSKNNGTIY